MASSFTGKEYNIYRGKGGPGGPVIRDTATIPELGPDDVLIRITHSGVCFTDQEFYRLGSPVALGHEGTGVVEAIGSDVTTLKVGDRAGGGFHRHSCGKCQYCLTGQDIHCYERTVFGFGDFNNGTFGQYYLGKETYVHRIPDGLASEDSAPLHCAGATVYSALTDTVKERDRVGIIGIGGLGHLAIQFAAKMGVEVVVFSSSADKEAEARAFGAFEFVLLSEPEKISAPVDVLILAGSKYPDWTKFLDDKILARNGTIVPLAAPTQGPLTLPADKLFWSVFHVHSTLVASKGKHADMLRFAARNGVRPLIQKHKFEGVKTIEKIFKDLEDGKVRYRAVIEF